MTSDEVARLVARFDDGTLPKALLMSAEARFGWVEPDLRPIA